MTGIEHGATDDETEGLTWFRGEVDYNIKVRNKLGREVMPSEGINRNIRNAAKAPKGRGYTVYWKYVTDNRVHISTVIL